MLDASFHNATDWLLLAIRRDCVDLFCVHPSGTRVIRRLTQKAYDWRLRAVPYHYTAFYDAHINGCSVMRPALLQLAIRHNDLPH